MDTWTLPRMLNTFKGAPLACYLALLWLGRPAGELELAPLAGYERGTVRRALQRLELFGFAESPGGYGSWRLTALAAQLLLFTPSQLGGGNLGVLNTQIPSSSSSLINTYPEEVKVKLLLLPRADLGAKNTQISEECRRLAEILVTRTGCRRERAQAAVQTALGEHELSPAEVEIEIISWTRYCATTKGVNNPGAFIAAKLSRNEPAPAGVDLGNNSDDYWRVQALRRQAAGVWEQGSEDEDDAGADT